MTIAAIAAAIAGSIFALVGALTAAGEIGDGHRISDFLTGQLVACGTVVVIGWTLIAIAIFLVALPKPTRAHPRKDTGTGEV